MPVNKETLKFFDLQFTEGSPISNNNGSNNSDIVEQSESTGKFSLTFLQSMINIVAYSKNTNIDVIFTVSSTACWKDDNEVRCLIHLWRDNQNIFKSKKSRDVWALICQELNKASPVWKKKTPIQCENKWKDIKRKYMETKDHNNNSGNDPRTCKFYEELEEVLGEKPCVKPVAIASNLNKKRAVSSEEQNDSEENEDSGSSTQTQKTPKQKKKMTRVQRELKDWSAALLIDAKTREEAKERRHKEIIAESKATVEAYKEIMTKLIDKL